MSSVKRLGSRASHGCIRLTVADAKLIYDNVGAGTQVRIHEDAPLDPELKAAHKPGSLNTRTYLHNATPAPTQEPLYDGSRAPAGGMRTLKAGLEGEDVFWLQSKLKELGYYHGTVTGTFLDGTKEAVKAFQREHKLKVNGTADVKTLEFLYQLVAQTTTPVPTPLPTDPPSTVSEGQTAMPPLVSYVVDTSGD